MKLPSGLRRRVSRKTSNQNENLKGKTMQPLALIKTEMTLTTRNYNYAKGQRVIPFFTIIPQRGSQQHSYLMFLILRDNSPWFSQDTYGADSVIF